MKTLKEKEDERMETITQALSDASKVFLSVATSFTFKDAIDIAVVTFLIYSAIKLIRETRAGQLVKGIILLIVVFLISSYLDLLMVSEFLRYFFQYALVALLIVFQPEIRKALEQMGRGTVGRSITSAFGSKSKISDGMRIGHAIDETVEAVALLQQMHMGAIIVFERRTILSDVANTGTIIDADPTSQIIGNIFFDKAPLHDGAMIMRSGRIFAAGCILPLTTNPELSASLGTRHRAALGLSEETDAVIVVVSEETAQISLAVNGRLKRDYNRLTLSEALRSYLLEGEGQQVSGGRKILNKLGFGSKKKEAEKNG